MFDEKFFTGREAFFGVDGIEEFMKNGKGFLDGFGVDGITQTGTHPRKPNTYTPTTTSPSRNGSKFFSTLGTGTNPDPFASLRTFMESIKAKAKAKTPPTIHRSTETRNVRTPGGMLKSTTTTTRMTQAFGGREMEERLKGKE